MKATFGEKKCDIEFYDWGSSILPGFGDRTPALLLHLSIYKPWMVIIEYCECHLVDSTILRIRKAQGEAVTVAVNSEKAMRPE